MADSSLDVSMPYGKNDPSVPHNYRLYPASAYSDAPASNEGYSIIPPVDPLKTYSSGKETARIITILPVAGDRTLKTGSWDLKLKTDSASDAIVNGSTVKIALIPTAPTFGYLFPNGKYVGPNWTGTQPTATQSGPDTIHVSVPVRLVQPRRPVHRQSLRDHDSRARRCRPCRPGASRRWQRPAGAGLPGPTGDNGRDPRR